jgi:uncharacterized protein (DUF2384 family)
MTKDDGHLSPQGIEALHKRFQEQSRKAQAYYTIMHRVRGVVGNDDAASAWMNQPLPAFDGKTPAQLVSDGCEDDVLGYVESLKPRSSG